MNDYEKQAATLFSSILDVCQEEAEPLACCPDSTRRTAAEIAYAISALCGKLSAFYDREQCNMPMIEGLAERLGKECLDQPPPHFVDLRERFPELSDLECRELAHSLDRTLMWRLRGQHRERFRK